MRQEIFISYRRSDEPECTRRIYSALAKKFPADALFMDVASIKPSMNWVSELTDRVSSCDVLLAIVGPGWVHASDEHGVQRLSKPDDRVLIEISTALRQQKRVIPVLVNDAAMPTRMQVRGLEGLLNIQSASVGNAGSESELAPLMETIETAFSAIRKQRVLEDEAHKAQAHALGQWRVLTRSEIGERVRAGALPTKWIRLVRRARSGLPRQLGGPEAMGAFCGDHEEYKGRFLKDIVRDMFGRFYQTGDDREWLAIKFEIEPNRFSEFRPVPATMEAIHRLCSSVSPYHYGHKQSNEYCRKMFDTLCRNLAVATGASAGVPGIDEYDAEWRGRTVFITDEMEEQRRQSGMSRTEFVMNAFGLDLCFHGSGRGQSEFAARHFIVRNRPLDTLSFEIQQLGKVDDLVILT
jgi:hypothetical protein